MNPFTLAKAKEILKKYFPELTALRFLYTFRSEARTGGEGEQLLGQVRALSPKDRDIYEYDFEIELAEDLWASLTEKGKKRVLYHEFRHCKIDTLEADGEVILDKAGRVKIYCEPHDLQIKTFKDEIKEFGLTSGDWSIAKFLKGAISRKKRDKTLAEEVGID